jgi:hypothetical protein
MDDNKLSERCLEAVFELLESNKQVMVNLKGIKLGQGVNQVRMNEFVKRILI